MSFEPAPGPATVVIFGASGDLTRRKLFPALYHLAAANLLDDGFAVLGVARESMTEAVRLMVQDEIDVALAVQRDVFRAMARDGSVTVSDIVILYSSSRLTVRRPPVLTQGVSIT